MGNHSSKSCVCICGRPPKEDDWYPYQPSYPDVIDPITAVLVRLSPGGIRQDIGSSVYGSRHTFTRVTVGGMAHRAGVREGYQLVSVDGVSVEGLSHDHVIKKFNSIEGAFKMEVRRPCRGSSSSESGSADSASDMEVITVHIRMEEITAITPEDEEPAQAFAHNVRLQHDNSNIPQNHVQHKYGGVAGVLLPGNRGGAYKHRGALPSSKRADAIVNLHSFRSAPPVNGTYVVLQFNRTNKFFTAKQGGLRIERGGPVRNITSPDDARVFHMTAVSASDVKFESAKFPGRFLTIHRQGVQLRTAGSTVESQYFQLHCV